MEVNDGTFLLFAEVASLHVRSQIVYPSQSTTLPTPHQSYHAFDYYNV